jgi:hypothetical protein
MVGGLPSLTEKGSMAQRTSSKPLPDAVSGSRGSCPEELSGSDKGPHPESPGQAASQSGV